MSTDRGPRFDAVDERYSALYRRALDVFGADQRVVRVDVHGSVAAGTADEWSDLDLKVIARDADVGAVCDDWEVWLGAITPTVFAARPLAPFIINSVTGDGLTFDVSVWAESAPEWNPPPGFTVGMMSGQRFTDYPAAVDYAVTERLRGLAGPLIRFLRRGDHVAHFIGLGHSLSLLITVLLAETETPITSRPPAGALTKEQKWLIANLPAAQPSFESLLAYELAVGAEVITRGRRLFTQYGREWPRPLEAVALANLRTHLHVSPAWLHE